MTAKNILGIWEIYFLFMPKHLIKLHVPLEN